MNFNPRTPHGVRPLQITPKGNQRKISIHAPHTGCDLREKMFRYTPIKFQSTHPTRGATTLYSVRLFTQYPFQSTHPTRGATCINARPHGRYLISIHAPHTGCDGVQLLPIDFFVIISIHAPHTGCDARATARAIIDRQISIHAPHTGCDKGVKMKIDQAILFQSTHPTRGATAKTRKLMQKTSSQSITMHLM